MIVEQAKEQFRPITLTLETQDEWDKYCAVVGWMAEASSHANLPPSQYTYAAKYLLNQVKHLIDN